MLLGSPGDRVSRALYDDDRIAAGWPTRRDPVNAGHLECVTHHANEPVISPFLRPSHVRRYVGGLESLDDTSDHASRYSQPLRLSQRIAESCVRINIMVIIMKLWNCRLSV